MTPETFKAMLKNVKSELVYIIDHLHHTELDEEEKLLLTSLERRLDWFCDKIRRTRMPQDEKKP